MARCATSTPTKIQPQGFLLYFDGVIKLEYIIERNAIIIRTIVLIKGSLYQLTHYNPNSVSEHLPQSMSPFLIPIVTRH